MCLNTQHTNLEKIGKIISGNLTVTAFYKHGFAIPSDTGYHNKSIPLEKITEYRITEYVKKLFHQILKGKCNKKSEDSV